MNAETLQQTKRKRNMRSRNDETQPKPEPDTTTTVGITRLRERGPNWSHTETQLLVTLVAKYLIIIGDKGNNHRIAALKQEAWQFVEDKMAEFFPRRDKRRLRQKWQRMRSLMSDEEYDKLYELSIDSLEPFEFVEVCENEQATEDLANDEQEAVEEASEATDEGEPPKKKQKPHPSDEQVCDDPLNVNLEVQMQSDSQVAVNSGQEEVSFTTKSILSDNVTMNTKDLLPISLIDIEEEIIEVAQKMRQDEENDTEIELLNVAIEDLALNQESVLTLSSEDDVVIISDSDDE